MYPLDFCFLRNAFFFFQAEDGIRDGTVTRVQTCALPIFVNNGFWRCAMGNLKGSARINVIRNIVTWWSGLGWAISLFLVVGALIVWEFVTPSKETGSDFLSVTAILMMAINIIATLLIVRDVTARTRFYAE